MYSNDLGNETQISVSSSYKFHLAPIENNVGTRMLNFEAFLYIGPFHLMAEEPSTYHQCLYDDDEIAYREGQ